MKYDYTAYLNINSFLLSLVIIISIVLCVITTIFFWFKNTSRRTKIAFTYLIAVTIIYQSSTLFAFYAPPGFFQSFIYIKICAAFLLKTAFLFFVAVYIDNRILEWFFLILQILSFATLIPAFLLQSYRDSIVTFTAFHMAQYGWGAQLYAVVSSVFYIVSGFIFYFSNRLFKQKKLYLGFLMLFTALNLLILILSVFGAKDVVYEKMHLFILLMLLATLFKMSPFYDKKDSLLSDANIIDSVGEALIILDKQGKAGFINNCIKGFDVSRHIEKITGIIGEHGNLPGIRENKAYPEENAILEGDIDLRADKNFRFHYSLAPLFYRNTFIGSICVLRDITGYKNLLDTLLEKNVLLHEAFEAQKEHMKVMRRLITEEERSRILEIVNNIAGDYLINLKRQVALLELAEEENALSAEKAEWENSRMLVMTRDTIEKIRSTVRQLYKKQERGENG